jgi:hypothetical protein
MKKGIALIVMQGSGCELTVRISVCLHEEDFLGCLIMNATVQLE